LWTIRLHNENLYELSTNVIGRASGSPHQSPRKLQDANQPNFMALDTWRNLKQE